MMWQALLLFSLLFFGDQFCSIYEKQSDGVLFELTKKKDTDAQWMKVQVCSDEIIRVIASPVKSFSTRPSLMADKTVWEPVNWSMKQLDDYIEISTAKLKVRVKQETGAVTFLDKNENIILQERSADGKVITPARVMDEDTYNIRQFFNSPEDEAFYGLGGHQNGIMNYKGHDVDMWQYNTIDIIPFLVSSRNYGILWDNNSRTKFGDIREYKSISSLKLYDKDGKEGGLTAEYFSDTEFKNLFTTRTESRIEHEFLDVNDKYPAGFSKNNGSIRWTGQIGSDVNGVHKFRFYVSSYVKMWIDGKLIVDSWKMNWLPWTHLPTIEMLPGEKHSIKIEWIPFEGYIGLKYLDPINEDTKNTISLYSEVADLIDYYFVHGSNIDEVIHGYREITGKTPMMPKWAMGLWQSREHYNTQDEILSVVKEFRDRKIPIDNIVQDWFYWKEDKWGEHEFEASRFPDPAGMIKKLHEKYNTHLMISVWPKFYVGTKNYDELNNKGLLYTQNVLKKQKDWVGPGYYSTFYDPYSTSAREIYWRQIDEKLFKLGVDAWWLDSTEPDIQSNLSLPELMNRVSPTALGTAARYLNTYSLMNSKAVYEGQRKSDPDKRVFILTRSAFAGQQRYASATWSGDVVARWSDLKIQISTGLNFSISGIPYWTSDIGGFGVEKRYEDQEPEHIEEWRELNTRWFQFAVFCPLLRSHGKYPYREIFNIAPEEHPAYKAMLAYDKLRYRLMPYIYSLSGMVTQNDYTIMRALVMDFGKDSRVYNINDQYMFGPALLVNPVTEFNAREREVYLPEGTGWYEFKTGKYFNGGQKVIADAPYSDIPVFIKEGSIIPCGPEIQYAAEKPDGIIRLFVYTGKDGSFNLYEDENVNYNYEKGKFSIIPFTYSEENKTLKIGKRLGSFNGMIESRKFEIVWITKTKSGALDFSMTPDEAVTFNGNEIHLKLK
ncbi:MAG: DUF4968 domain-containing protein [Ignavibacteriales bacterium]|nr:MAG: DUF4968 domain-containing protein [Ignavibacteriales bacterium]